MTRRSKLSLDPSKHAKAPPPHGLDEAEATGAPSAGEHQPEPAEGSGSGEEGAHRRGIGPPPPQPRHGQGAWQAHTPVQATDDGRTATSGAMDSAQREQPGSSATPPHDRRKHLSHSLRTLAKRPVVRAVAAGLVTGLAVYLLRRRLF
jgi:hypothetical protein